MNAPQDAHTVAGASTETRRTALLAMAVMLTALGCEPVLIETTNETRHALTGEALLAAHRSTIRLDPQHTAGAAFEITIPKNA